MKLKYQIKTVTSMLDSLASPYYAESYDNVGLLIGDPMAECTGILIALDALEPVLDEAISLGYNLVVTHHPIIFSGLKKLSTEHYVNRIVRKAIKHDIALYAIHTNLDNVSHGVNQKFSDKIGLQNTKILQPKSHTLSKLITFVPTDHTEIVAEAMYSAGAGNIGNYSKASFRSQGIGTFQGNEHSNPVVGQSQQYESVAETKLEVIVPNHKINEVLSVLHTAHPYEEVAYDLLPLSNYVQNIGSGMIGTLSEPMTLNDFLSHLSQTFGNQAIKYTQLNRPIHTVAVCGGSGSFLIHQAKALGADALVTSDIKYHEFIEGDHQMSIIDIGHYESEKFTCEIILEWFEKNELFLPAQISRSMYNPVSYWVQQ